MSGEDASCVILPLAAIEVHLPKSEICEFPLISISFSTIILYFEYLKCYLRGLRISRLHDRLFKDVKIDILKWKAPKRSKFSFGTKSNWLQTLRIIFIFYR